MDGVLMIPSWPVLVPHAASPLEDVVQVEHPDGSTRQVLDCRVDLSLVPPLGLEVTELTLPVGIGYREEYDVQGYHCRYSYDFLQVRRNFGRVRSVVIIGPHADDQGVSMHSPLVLDTPRHAAIE